MSAPLPLPSLASAPFLADPAVKAVFAAIGQGGDEIRAVGGAVRDVLLGRATAGVEVDLATTATPDVVTARAVRAGMRAVPTGIDHGTVTVVTAGRSFEVTTLRQDVETDGRRAVVRFGRDWTADALRRDFTINALSVSADGTLHDPAAGYADILAKRIRFIGDPDQRSAEDRLRLLRFFRFHAQLGFGAMDRDALGAAIRARRGIPLLAAERVGQEMRKLLVAPGAADVAVVMQDAGILTVVLGTAYPAQLRREMAFEGEAGLAPTVPRRLGALAVRIAEDIARVADRLRLANAERVAMEKALAASPRLDPLLQADDARRLAYRLTPDGFADALAQAAAMGGGDPTRFGAPIRAVAGWTVPVFPVTGTDLLAAGMRPGPILGKVLETLEEWWIGKGFAPDRTALLSRLQQTVAAQQ